MEQNYVRFGEPIKQYLSNRECPLWAVFTGDGGI